MFVVRRTRPQRKPQIALAKGWATRSEGPACFFPIFGRFPHISRSMALIPTRHARERMARDGIREVWIEAVNQPEYQHGRHQRPTADAGVAGHPPLGRTLYPRGVSSARLGCCDRHGVFRPRSGATISGHMTSIPRPTRSPSPSATGRARPRKSPQASCCQFDRLSGLARQNPKPTLERKPRIQAPATCKGGYENGSVAGGARR